MKDPPRLVRDLMKVGVDTCKLDTPFLDLARLMLNKNIEAVVVLDDEGCAQGVISMEELAMVYPRFIETGTAGIEGYTAGQVMREGVPQVTPETPLGVAAQMMHDQGVRAVFLMHHAGGIEYPAAELTYTQLVRHMTAGDPEELADLGVGANRTLPLEAFIKRRDEARRRNK